MHLRDKYSLMILITRDKAWSSAALHRVSILSQTHPVVVVNISSANPFESSAHFHSIYAEDSTLATILWLKFLLLCVIVRSALRLLYFSSVKRRRTSSPFSENWRNFISC